MATDLVIVSTAPLVMEYAKRSATPMNATIDAIFRMTPPPCRTMSGTAARVHRNTPFTFTRYRRSNSVSAVCSMLPTCATPALLIRRSMRLLRAAIASNVELTAAPSDTSHADPSAVPPERTISAAVSFAASPSRSSTTTCAPWRPKSVEIARPMPDPPPVTTATFPLRLNNGPHALRYYTLHVKSTNSVYFIGKVNLRRQPLVDVDRVLSELVAQPQPLDDRVRRRHGQRQ